MSYMALYRKFRPTEFGDVRGQDHIVTTLKNQINADRIGHAYLFCGTRGTGKTTVAKIFARAVNCEHPVDGNPCGTCAACRSIAAGTSMNVIEIDAASNNGVDNIREIRDEVAYSPTEGKYKVYIIDEVHMLSIGAFNALLKTLEEPPSYVIFILATTEAHKIPVTILSRCQRYDFRRITADTITARLQELTEKEGVETEEKALRYIAKAADGSMRDALSLLDQCIAFYLNQKLTYDHVLDVLGAVDIEVYSKLLRMTLERNLPGVMAEIEELVIQGRELGQFVTDFTWYLRNLLLLKSNDNMEDILDVSTENLARLKEEALQIEDDTLMRYIRIFSELGGQIRYASQKRVSGGGGLYQAVPSRHGDEDRRAPGSHPRAGTGVRGEDGRTGKRSHFLRRRLAKWSARKCPGRAEETCACVSGAQVPARRRTECGKELAQRAEPPAPAPAHLLKGRAAESSRRREAWHHRGHAHRRGFPEGDPSHSGD